MEYWSDGVLEYWVSPNTPLLQYSITPPRFHLAKLSPPPAAELTSTQPLFTFAPIVGSPCTAWNSPTSHSSSIAEKDAANCAAATSTTAGPAEPPTCTRTPKALQTSKTRRHSSSDPILVALMETT